MPRTNAQTSARPSTTSPQPCHAPAPGTASPARDPIPGHKWTEVTRVPAILPALNSGASPRAEEARAPVPASRP